MAFILRNLEILCPSELLTAINDDTNIGVACVQIVNTQVGSPPEQLFDFVTALTAAQETAFDSLLSTFVCGDVPVPVDPTNIGDSVIPNPGDVLEWDGTQWVPVPASSGGLVGSIIQLPFVRESSNVKNTWLSHYGDNSLSSDKTTAIVPFACSVIGLTYSNQQSGVDVDVEIHAADANTTLSSQTTRYTQVIRNQRFVSDTTMTGVDFNAGDKVGVFLKDQGTNSKYVTVVLYLKITDDTTLLHQENISGGMTSND